jgi:hypothetical protein
MSKDSSSNLVALARRLLAKAPNERPESAADVLAALEAIDLLAAGDFPSYQLHHLVGGREVMQVLGGKFTFQLPHIINLATNC